MRLLGEVADEHIRHAYIMLSVARCRNSFAPSCTPKDARRTAYALERCRWGLMPRTRSKAVLSAKGLP